MNPQEAQQAQTIAGIRKRHEIDSADFDLMSVDELFKDRATLLEIVDSQAQKIAQLTKERDDARKCAEDFRDDEYDNDNDVDLSIAENRIARREYAKAHPLPWEKQ